MPFKSQAQRAKFLELLKRGEISQATFDEWQAATGDKPLPERVSPKPKTGPFKGGALKGHLKTSAKKKKKRK